MSDRPEEPPVPHKRRPRYSGTHPKRFDERYKELAAERYPGIVEHVRAKGRTPAGQHVPILVEEILEVLGPRAGERGVDATLGFGGHAQRLLARLAPGGQLLGLDVDPAELPRTAARLRSLGHGEDDFIAHRCNFAGLPAALATVGWNDGADFVLADLGVSSMQLDDPSRGFTFADDGPLDMRMNPARGLSAADWLARASRERIARALAENADEPHAEPIADVLATARPRTTGALATAVRHALEGTRAARESDDTVRRVFQALRIEVNDEFAALEAFLRVLPGCLRPGGRVAILSFHSGEDRRVKHAFADGVRAGDYAEAARDVIRAGSAERYDNPRSKPAKLRWARRGAKG